MALSLCDFPTLTFSGYGARTIEGGLNRWGGRRSAIKERQGKPVCTAASPK